MMLSHAQAVYQRIMTSPDLPLKQLPAPCELAENGAIVEHDNEDPRQCTACQMQGGINGQP